MRYATGLVLVLVGCGSPFADRVPPPPPADEAAIPDDAALRPDRRGTHLPEAGHEASSDAGHEEDVLGVDIAVPDVVTPPSDAGHDAGPPPPTDAGCTPYVPGGPTSCGAVGPGQFCTELGGYLVPTKTPPECMCAATFNCACLYANGVDTPAFCGALSPPVQCKDYAGGPVVQCP